MDKGMVMSEPTIEDVAAKMIEIRDARAKLKEAFEAADAVWKARWEKGEAWLLNKLNTDGSQGYNTHVATITKTSRMTASAADWGAFAQWIRDTGEVDLLEHRISSKNLKEYLEVENAALPPGVALRTELSVSIRRK